MRDVAFQLKQQIKMFSQNVYLPAVYNLHRFSKIEKDLVVFADAHHDSRPEAMELLYRKLRRDGRFKVRQMYMDFGRASAKQVFDFSSQFMELYAKASVVVICDNFLPVASCRKKDETLVVQLWHGCGCYKKFGYDAADDVPEGYQGEVFRNMDLVTVSAKAAVEPFESAMHREIGQVKALGVSRTDIYYSQKWRTWCQGSFRRKYPGAEGKKVVLWAPTFRGNAGLPELPALDIGKLQKELGEDYLVLAKLHPHMKEDQKQKNHDCPIPTDLLYPVVDVLIADYSSLIYEYLLVSRIRRDTGAENAAGGMVLYVPDLAEYQSKRGFYMDIREIPGQVVQSEEKLADAVRKAAEPDAAGVKKAESDTFLDRYMSACDGHATSRIADEIRKHCGF